MNNTHTSPSPFHIVPISPWPILISLTSIALVVSLLHIFYTHEPYLVIISLAATSFVSYIWWRDISREGHHEGQHSENVQNGMRVALLLFISSEVIFFAAFFWIYFNSASNSVDITSQDWPPKAITPIHALSAPLLNTIVLLISGSAATWVHIAFPVRCRTGSSIAFTTVVFLGFWFAFVQNTEYSLAEFSNDCSVFGSTFYVATGFHGTHVLIGATFLIACLTRGRLVQYTNNHHFGFEAAAWYWHFVDVVWLFLFVIVYWYSTGA